MRRDWTNFCKSCGACCGVFPIDKAIFLRNLDKLQRAYGELVQAENCVVPVTEDGFCVFLTAEKRCSIYEERPDVCRLYGEIPALQCTNLQGLGVDHIAEMQSAPLSARRYLKGKTQ